MAIKDRVARSHYERKEVKKIKELKFIGNAENDNLASLSLEQLAQQFDSIGQQAQLLQGRILLEARSRFKSDVEFGAWCMESPYLSSVHQTTRTRLLNLAKFFSDRELDKISITAAYEISAPRNADVAAEIYEMVRGKNLPVAEVKRKIAIKQGKDAPINPVDDNPVFAPDEAATKPVVSEEIEIIGHKPIPEPAEKQVLLMPAIVSTGTEFDIKEKVLADVSGVSAIVGIRLLQECVKELQDRMYK